MDKVGRKEEGDELCLNGNMDCSVYRTFVLNSELELAFLKSDHKFITHLYNMGFVRILIPRRISKNIRGFPSPSNGLTSFISYI